MNKILAAAFGLVVLSSGASLASTIPATGPYQAISALLFEEDEFDVVDGEDSYENGGGDLSPVPLPAAGWMLIAAVGGLVALRRRAKA